MTNLERKPQRLKALLNLASLKRCPFKSWFFSSMGPSREGFLASRQSVTYSFSAKIKTGVENKRLISKY